MKKPNIFSWQLSKNEKGLKMATIPLWKMHEIARCLEHIDSVLEQSKACIECMEELRTSGN